MLLGALCLEAELHKRQMSVHYPKVTAILRDDYCAIDACLIDFILFFDICSILQQTCVIIIIFICAYNYVEDPQMIQLLLYVDIAVGNSAFSSFSLTCQNRPCISKL